MRKTEPAIRFALLMLLVLGAAGLGASRWMSRGDARLISDYTAPPDVPRLTFAGDSVPPMTVVRRFDGDADALYLLDAALQQVHVLHHGNGHWVEDLVFGARGGGPGELLQPSGIALLLDGRIAIMDQARIHFFDRGGVYQQTTVPKLPCPLNFADIHALAGGIAITGRCQRADTVSAELYWSRDGGAFEALTHEPLYTMDGTFGSPFVAQSLLTSDAGGGMFGGGILPCLTQLTAVPAAAPQLHRICDDDAPRFAFHVDPALRAKTEAIAKSRPGAAGALVLPAELPYFVDRIRIGESTILLRPVLNDSIALRRIGDNRDLLVLPFEGFVGCRARGCLWLRAEAERSSLMFVSADSLHALMDGRI